MRVLVASGAVGNVPAAAASTVVARAFHAEGAEVAVVDLQPEWPTPTEPQELERVLADGADLVDLRQFQFRHADVAAAAHWLARRKWTAVVADDEVSAPLTGLTGAAVQRSRAQGEDLAAGLAADAAAQAWLTDLGLSDGAGAGAVGGFGALLLHHGVRIASALDVAMEQTDFISTAAKADLVVTGCTDLDFHARGGPLVERVVMAAGAALCPAIVVCGRNYVSARELRLASIESAHAVHPGDDARPVEEPDLALLARRVARTWRF